MKKLKKQFEISGDVKLIEFLENLENRNQSHLDVEIVRFFTDFEDNADARQLIVDVIKQDLEDIRKNHKDIKEKLKNFKEKK